MPFRPALRRLAVPVVAAASLSLAAPALVAAPAGAATKPAKWGTAFCSGLTTWAEEIVDGAEGFKTQVSSATVSPTQAKALLVDYLDDAIDMTADFATTVRKAGAPDTKNGAKIQRTILEGIDGVEAMIADLADDAQRLPTTDAATFKAAAGPLAEQLGDVSMPFEDAMDEVSRLDKGKQLAKQMKKVKACKGIA